MKKMMLSAGKEETRLGGIHRRYKREVVNGFSGDIATGNHIVAGEVENVSANGFKLVNISGKFKASEHLYQTIISGDGKHYRLLAKPCWEHRSGGGLEIGFKIVDAPWEWLELILKSIPGHEIRVRPQGHA